MLWVKTPLPNYQNNYIGWKSSPKTDRFGSWPRMPSSCSGSLGWYVCISSPLDFQKLPCTMQPLGLSCPDEACPHHRSRVMVWAHIPVGQNRGNYQVIDSGNHPNPGPEHPWLKPFQIHSPTVQPMLTTIDRSRRWKSDIDPYGHGSKLIHLPITKIVP